MNAVLRILGVAACEVAEAFRSRRFILVLLLFFSASAVSMYGSTAFLGHLEKNAAKMLGLPEGDGKGAVTRVVWKSKPFRGLVKSAVDDDPDLYAGLVGRHPLALLYAFFTFFAVPMLSLLAGANRIADDVKSGAVRFMLVRVRRAEWVLGKYIGLAMLLLPGLAGGALVAYAMACARMPDSGAGALLPEMLVFAGKAWLLSLAWTGVALGVSETVKSGSRATSLGILALMVLGIMPWLLNWLSGVFVHLEILCPSHFKGALSSTSTPRFAFSAVMLAAQGLFYLSCGYLVFSRRDAR